jgi:hypothetical protein
MINTISRPSNGVSKQKYSVIGMTNIKRKLLMIKRKTNTADKYRRGV